MEVVVSRSDSIMPRNLLYEGEDMHKHLLKFQALLLHQFVVDLLKSTAVKMGKALPDFHEPGNLTRLLSPMLRTASVIATEKGLNEVLGATLDEAKARAKDDHVWAHEIDKQARFLRAVSAFYANEKSDLDANIAQPVTDNDADQAILLLLLMRALDHYVIRREHHHTD